MQLIEAAAALRGFQTGSWHEVKSRVTAWQMCREVGQLAAEANDGFQHAFPSYELSLWTDVRSLDGPGWLSNCESLSHYVEEQLQRG